MPHRLFIPVIFFFLFGCQSPPPKVDKYPETPRHEVVDTYHGVKVKDPYRWLEKTRESKVKVWAKAQTDLARSYLDNIPSQSDINDRMEEILAAKDINYYALEAVDGGFLALKNQPEKKQAVLVFIKSLDTLNGERVMVDPNAIDSSGSTTIKAFSASPTSKNLGVVFSKAGTEVGNLHIYDFKTLKEVSSPITHVYGPTAGGSVTWLSDEEFLHTGYPLPSERSKDDAFFYQQIYRHKIGQKGRTYELGKKFDRISATKLSKSPEGPEVLATVQYGDSGQFDFYLRDAKGKWLSILKQSAAVKEAKIGYDNWIYMVSFKNAPRGKLLKMPLKSPRLAKARVVIPQGKDTIVTNFYRGTQLLPLKKNLVLIYQMGGPSQMRVFDLKGKRVKPTGSNEIAAIKTLVKTNNENGFAFSKSSYLVPHRYFKFDLTSGAIVKSEIGHLSPIRLDGVKVVRDFATSKDGTKVPVNILLPKNYVAGKTYPLILTGYGGYGINLSPGFDPSLAVWLERGGIYAIANLRGGGEYGKKWHDQGRLTKKQNVFDDFYAVAKLLKEKKYTTTKQLGITGGSNGGLLMGAMLAQHPQEFKAVVTRVGIYDSLRSELSPNGAFNIPEFGTVKKKNEFKALYSYSPYHQAKPSTYPNVLITTGINDNRVDPMHSLKMAAQLQSLNKGQAPVLLRVDMGTGHGQGDSVDMKVKKKSDLFSFFDYHLRKEI